MLPEGDKGKHEGEEVEKVIQKTDGQYILKEIREQADTEAEK